MLEHEVFRFLKNLVSMRQSYKVSENSKRSFSDLAASGRMESYKHRILSELAKKASTRRELAKKLRAGSPSNLCSPLKELENQGLVKVVGNVSDHFTGREVSLYGLVAKENPLYINRDYVTYKVTNNDSNNSKNLSE